ncbi:hypothetical protein N9B82_02675 [Saprospiraceae bacterium]|nr:hypothetical protein [Saprospiraceae bacterium]
MKIYKILPETNHSGDSGRDAFLVPFQDARQLKVSFWKIDNIPDSLSTDTIYFDANFDLISMYDFPYLDVSLPVMSDKMIHSIGLKTSLMWDLYPVVMLKDTYLASKFDENNKLRPNVPIDKRFSVIHLKSYFECFDYDKSKFITYQGSNSMTITNMVLKNQSFAFPSIFRIKEEISSLFVTEETKMTFEENKIKGIVYNEVETSI